MTNVLFFQSPGPDLSGAPLSAPTVHLTPRQLDVLRLLCTGEPNKVIGRKLGIASATVKVHVSCILRMLKVTSRLQAVIEAQKQGLVVIDPSLDDDDGGRRSRDPIPMVSTPQGLTPAPAPASARVMPFAQVASAE